MQKKQTKIKKKPFLYTLLSKGKWDEAGNWPQGGQEREGQQGGAVTWCGKQRHWYWTCCSPWSEGLSRPGSWHGCPSSGRTRFSGPCRGSLNLKSDRSEGFGRSLGHANPVYPEAWQQENDLNRPHPGSRNFAAHAAGQLPWPFDNNKQNPEQKLVRPSVGVDGNSGTHSFPECFSGVAESAMCVQSWILVRRVWEHLI